MKTLLIALLFIGAPILLSAQNFEKYADMDKVDGILITQNMFKLLSGGDYDSKDPDAQKIAGMVNSLKNIQVYSTSDKSIGASMKKDVKAYVANSKLDKLMQIKESGDRIAFYSKPGKESGKISQLFMFISDGSEDGEFVILSINGNIDLNNIGKMGEMLKVPGAKALKNVKSN